MSRLLICSILAMLSSPSAVRETHTKLWPLRSCPTLMPPNWASAGLSGYLGTLWLSQKPPEWSSPKTPVKEKSQAHWLLSSQLSMYTPAAYLWSGQGQRMCNPCLGSGWGLVRHST